MSDEPYVPPKVTYNDEDSDDDMDIQIIEPIPMEDLSEEQLEGLKILAQKGTCFSAFTPSSIGMHV